MVSVDFKPFQTATPEGFTKMLTFMDVYSTRLFVFLIKHETEFYDIFCAYVKRILARGRRLVVLISDGAKVFSVEKRLAAFVRLKEITHVLTAPYS